MNLGSLFSNQSPPLVGLDVSASSIKLVELGQDRAGNLTLEHCGIEPLEQGWITDGAIDRFEDVVEAARRLVKKSGTRAKHAALALPASQVISKKIILPGNLSEREMEVHVESEAAQYIPSSLDEFSLDFCVLGPSPTAPGDVEVVVAAARKEKVEERQGLAEACGLQPAILDVETYASRMALNRLIRRLPNGGQNAVVALFEIGAAMSNMQVIRNDELLYERDQMFGGAQLTQAIAKHYGWKREEAEAKKRAGDLPEDSMDLIVQPYVENIAGELERALKLFFTSTPHNKVDYVLLAGGTASLPGLAEMVTRHTAFSCQAIDPFLGMDHGSGVRENRLKREAPSYLTACGLAMRRFVR